jgi:CubicO group peptidase (beta-lactamase class C family)
MLEAAGKLSAGDDIRKYLPELADFGPKITIRHLLNHTSGLRDQWDLLVLSGWRMDDIITQSDIMDRLKRQRELNFPPGDRYLYSNSGFTLLAEIVSRVSGQPFIQWTREQIFEPLGMTSTHFHLDHREIVRNRAYSYTGDPKAGYTAAPLNYANVGATSLFTTVEDMVNWIRNFEDKRVGGAAVMDMMLTKGVLADGSEIPYARGLTVAEYKGLKVVGHSGGDAGFRSDVIYFPGERFGVAVFSNLASFNPGGLTRQIADIYLASRIKEPGPAPAGTRTPPAKRPAAKPFTMPAKSLEAFQGTYWFESNRSVRKVVLEKDKLMYVRSEDNKSELVPVSPAEFEMRGVPNSVRVTFSDKAATHYDTVTVAVTNEPTVVGKWTEPFSPTADTLKEYAGPYYSPELDTRYDIVVKSGALAVLDRRGEETPAAAQMKDLFLAGGFATIQFKRDGNGAITGFTISTGRVLNLKFARVS